MVRLTNHTPVNRVFPNLSVVWAALEKVGCKEKQLDDLQDGSNHDLALTIEGTVNGNTFRQALSSVVAIGHEQTRISSVTPQVPELIALILSKLNAATQNRLLDDIPEEFEENENQLPECDQELLQRTHEMLRRVRATKMVKARGPIRCNYRLMLPEHRGLPGNRSN